MAIQRWKMVVYMLIVMSMFALYPFHFSITTYAGAVNLSYGDVAVAVVGLLWVGGVFTRHHLPKYILYLSLFLIIATISTYYNSLNPAPYFEWSSYIVSVLKLFGSVSWMIAVYVIGKEFGVKNLNTGLLVSLFCAVLLSVFGIYESMTVDALRPTATFGNPNLFANYLILHVFIGAYLLPRSNKKYLRLRQGAYTVGLVILLVGVLYTGSRGAILGLSVMIFFSAIFLFYKNGLNIMYVLPASISSVVGGVLFYSYNQALVDRMLDSRTLEIRLEMWTQAARIIYDNLKLGIGYGQLSNYLGYTIGKQIDPHNFYVLTVSETGLVGGIVMFALFCIVVKDGIEISAAHTPSIYILSGLIGILAQGAVTDINNFRSLWILVGVIAAIKQERESDWGISLREGGRNRTRHPGDSDC